MPTPAELNALYAQSWVEPTEHLAETGGTSLRLARSYARHLVRELGRANLHGLAIVDFGSGDGSMALALAELGARVCAVEPYGQISYSHPAIQVVARLDDLPLATPFDGAVSLQVVEHLPDPRPVVAQLAQRLSDGGWLLVTTPNAGGLRARLAGPRWSEAQKAGHLLLFTPRSLATLLGSVGLPECRRLRWTIQYAAHPLWRPIHAALQLTGLGGDLRYLAFKRRSPSASHG
jgi:SAM-dependent methyltransferase